MARDGEGAMHVAYCGLRASVNTVLVARKELSFLPVPSQYATHSLKVATR